MISAEHILAYTRQIDVMRFALEPEMEYKRFSLDDIPHCTDISKESFFFF